MSFERDYRDHLLHLTHDINSLSTSNLKTPRILPPTMPICTRRSCGQEQSSTSPCVFHPGSPVFHEGQKSWSCCKEINKPVLEFDEFMKIKGCQTLDSHSSEKLPVEIPKAKDDGGIMKGMSIDKDGKEIYGNQSQSNPNPTSSVNITQPMTNMNLNSSSNPSSKNGSANAGGGSKEEKKPKELEQDPKDVDPTEGTVCKRSGCGKAFQGGKRVREEESCTFHRGSAIFHEGSKGWTCCKRRVLDFNDFLTIEPCTTSDRGHLFIGAPKEPSSAGGEEEVQCKLDHYETPADVRLTVYAKGVDMEKSKIEFKEDEVIFSLSLPPLASNPSTARRFNKILLPFAPIDAEASTFSLTKFKVDCILIKKQKGQSWPVLERTDGVTGYGLTFGRE